jgi:hypothetical protein
MHPTISGFDRTVYHWLAAGFKPIYGSHHEGESRAGRSHSALSSQRIPNAASRLWTVNQDVGPDIYY